MKIAVPNIFGQETLKLKGFVKNYGVTSIDWSINPEISENNFIHYMEDLVGFEVRFHGKFQGIDLAYSDVRGDSCFIAYKKSIDMISKCRGKFLTIHLGLGTCSFMELDYQKAVDNIRRLNDYARERDISLCLENLARGWTSDPDIYREIIEKTGVSITFDIGHAKTKIYPSQNGYFFYKKFLTGFEDRVLNAHIYDYEIPKKGHIPPMDLNAIRSRLDILTNTCCDFWVIELYSPKHIIGVKNLLDIYLNKDK